MRALKVDDENLRNQRDVVKEEVRVNVLNQPYGGFPWLDMPPVAFRNWRTRIISTGFATWMQRAWRMCRRFPDVLRAEQRGAVAVGDVKPEEGFALAEKYFAPIPAGAGATVCGSAGASAGGRAAGTRRGKIRDAAGDGHRLCAAGEADAGVVRHGAAGPGAARGRAGRIHANWCWKSRLPWKRMEGSRICSGTTGQRN